MNALEKGINAQLKTPATTLYSLVSTRTYNSLAPQGMTKPYVVFAQAGGGDLNETPMDRVELLYVVKGIADSQIVAGQIDDAIRERLHNQSFSLTGWTLIGLMRESEIRLQETVNNVIVYHAGAIYRFYLSK